MTATARPHAKAGPGPKTALQRTDLLAALSAVVPVINRRATVPIVGTVRWDGRTLTATDLDAWLAVSLPDGAPVMDPPVCLPGHKLLEIVKALALEPVVVTPSSTGVTLVNGRDRFQLRGMNPEEFPTMPAVEAAAVAVPAAELAGALHFTKHAACHEEARPILNGLHLEARGGALIVTACDGARLARRQLSAPGAACDLVLPQTAAERVVSLVGEAADDATVDMAVTPTRAVIAASGRWTLTTRLIEGPYPATDHIVRRYPNDRSVEIVGGPWVAALNRARTLSNTFAGIRGHRIIVRLAHGEATISSQDDDVGEATAVVGYSGEGDGIEFAANGRNLTESLTALGEGRLALHFSTPDRALHLTNAAGDLALVQPLRLAD